jgi:hypothetical protein
MASIHPERRGLLVAALCRAHADPALGSLWCPLCQEDDAEIAHDPAVWLH